jgi:hypothetical protein
MKKIIFQRQFYVLFTSIFLMLIFWTTVAPAKAISVDVHVPEKYTDVLAGERFYFEMEIKYPENPSRKDLRLEYDITKNGEIIAQSKFLKAVETQASFMDYIVIPESAEKGLYAIEVKITDYDGNVNADTSASFNVTAKGNEITYYFFILLGIIIIFGGFVVIEIRRIAPKKQRSQQN